MKTEFRFENRFLASAVLAGLFFGACSTAPTQKAKDADTLTEQACRAGKDTKKVTGSVWLKADSKEASGQFPAQVTVESPDHLVMEVTNLIGATEAIIRVEHEQYSIDIPSRKNQKAQDVKGQGTWGGIPLRWATDLFLGKIPCPSPEVLKQSSRLVSPDGNLVIQTPQKEFYEYSFGENGQDAVPQSLHYESKTVASAGKAASVLRVDFKFEDPEPKTLSPRKWEAKSDRGEVRVRWKDRAVSH
ncbi:MAG: hypothetical protein H7222_03545 [Methylotenera sp.]|nr:hypothetical protein [Oligoflexia bacterium]